ncbi:MAG: histidine kinase [Burkholderiaceae bacterium]
MTTAAPVSWRALSIEAAQVALGCMLVAALLWLTVPALGRYGYLNNLVHSEAIGLTAWGLLGVLLRRTRFYTIQPRWLMAPPLALGGIIAYVVGSSIAHLILGIPLANLFATQGAGLLPASVAITVLVTFVATLYFHGREKVAELRAEVAEEGRQAESARLAMLRAQIEPHMLFNTLSTLRALIPEDPAAAVRMLDDLNGFLRATLVGSRESMSTLAREFELLEHYLALMRVRMGDRLTTHFDLPEALRGQPIPSLLLQPLVENAIRHGLEPAIEGGELSVQAARAGDTILMTVTDTGVGFATPARRPTQAGTGFGLAAIRERLASTYGPAAALEIGPADAGGGTRAVIRIPSGPPRKTS